MSHHSVNQDLSIQQTVHLLHQHKSSLHRAFWWESSPPLNSSHLLSTGEEIVRDSRLSHAITEIGKKIVSSHCKLFWHTVAFIFLSVQFNSITQLCPSLCNPMNCSIPGLPVHHQLPEFTQTHVRRVGDAIQPSHPLSSPSPPVPNPSQHQGLFQWVNSSHEVAKVLEFQPQHQSFQWTPRTDLL